MANRIGIRREDKSLWERRVPLIPDVVARLVRDHGIQVVVERSAKRVYNDLEYEEVGAWPCDGPPEAPVIFGVKEIPPRHLRPNTTYVYFAHVIKGQAPNMPMLRRLMELGCTLIDYERIADAEGRRLIFFGRHAGLAGAIDTLWSLGQRLAFEGIPTPFATIRQTWSYDSLEDALSEVASAGEMIRERGLRPSLAPLIIGVAGYGNVGRGAQEVLDALGAVAIEPEQIDEVITTGGSPNRVYQVTFKEQHIVRPKDAGAQFELEEYYQHPERYEGSFAHYLPSLTALINCNYWTDAYPRLVTKRDLRALFAAATPPRLRALGDVGCDVGGAIECNLQVTEPGNPVYVWNPETDRISWGVAGHGPVVLAVDILPSELPKTASRDFSAALEPFVPAIAAADYSAPLEELALPDEIQRAVIVHRGELTDEYRYIAQALEGATGNGQSA